jgi:hypothetical protein
MLSDFPGRTIVADIRLLHRYKDKKALKEHGESAAFQKFQKGVSEQDLLLAPDLWNTTRFVSAKPHLAKLLIGRVSTLY